MRRKKFTYRLDELYILTDNIIYKITEPGVSETKINFYISDIIEITKELVINNCYKFIFKNNVTELTKDELYHLAITIALHESISSYKSEKGTHFLYYWFKIMNNIFTNEWLKLMSKKEKFNSRLYQLTKLSYVNDFTEELINYEFIYNCINEFIKQDKYGKLIKCELINSRKEKRKARLKFLNASEYGIKERKIVQRTKQRYEKKKKKEYKRIGLNVG